MPRLRLTDARVKAVKPRKNARDVRDAALRGVGVRVLPSGGKRFFVHCQHEGERIWRIVGDAQKSVADLRIDAPDRRLLNPPRRCRCPTTVGRRWGWGPMPVAR